MRQADCHFGPACQGTADQQGRSRQGGLDRHSGAETQPESGNPGRKVLVAGMDKDQSAKFSRDGKKAVQTGVGKLGVRDTRSDLDTVKAELTHTTAHLVDGSVGILQGNRAQRSEAGRVLVGNSCHEVVLGRRQFGRAAR